MTATDLLTTTRADRSLSVRPDPEERRAARTVVVPLANPETATDLLRTAYLLVDPQARSRIVACTVVVDDRDAEEERSVLSGLRDLVETVSDRLAGTTVEFRTASAPSVARGVLDAVRDTGADALVMGATQDEDGRTDIGAIGSSILDAAPCDVFVLGRPADRGIGDVTRVVVTVEDPIVTPTAVRVGVLASRSLQQPLEILHVMDGSDRHAPSLGHVVAGITGSQPVDVTTVSSDRVDVGLERTLRDDDLVVVGSRHGAHDQGWAEGSLTRRVLDTRDVLVLTVARHRAPQSESEHVARRALAWMRPRLTDVEQDTVRDSAEAASRIGLDYLLMMLLSGAIGALGLLLGSVPVIIGAMLVAPLMAPIQSFGIAVIDGRPAIATRAAGTVVAGSLLAILISAVIGLTAGELTPEVASRGAPTLLDAGVALAAGVAGAYATARRTIPAALAGVAIAAALVPPLSAVGVAAAIGAWELSLGGLLLFTVNIVCIAVTTAGVFFWLGLEAHDPSRRRHGSRRYLLGAVLLLGLTLAVSIALQQDAPLLDEAALATVVADASDGRAALMGAVVTDTAGGAATVRILVDLGVDGPVDAAADAAADADALTRRVLAAAQEEVAAQLGGDVRVRLVPLSSVPAG